MRMSDRTSVGSGCSGDEYSFGQSGRVKTNIEGSEIRRRTTSSDNSCGTKEIVGEVSMVTARRKSERGNVPSMADWFRIFAGTVAFGLSGGVDVSVLPHRLNPAAFQRHELGRAGLCGS